MIQLLALYSNLAGKKCLTIIGTEGDDILVLSGIFNLKVDVPSATWKSYVEETLVKIFQMSKIGVSFNFLTDCSNVSDSELQYYDPREMFDFCHTNLSRFINIDHSYPLYEFSVTVFKPHYIEKENTHDNFKKYFS